MTTTKQQLTTEDIEAGYQNPDWLGWGYLGERSRIEDDARVAQADGIALKLANEQDMSPVEFFSWLNSRPGRHYGDVAFGGESPAQVETLARKWNLVTRIQG